LGNIDIPVEMPTNKYTEDGEERKKQLEAKDVFEAECVRYFSMIGCIQN
jgi:hypothetical protein